MTSKQRAYLKGLAMNMVPMFQIGKSSVTPELTQAVAEALEARELIKLTVLKNCLDDGNAIAEVLAERTHSSCAGHRQEDRPLQSGKGRKERKIVLPESRPSEAFHGKDWNSGRDI